jgi:hypothetical protein
MTKMHGVNSVKLMYLSYPGAFHNDEEVAMAVHEWM